MNAERMPGRHCWEFRGVGEWSMVNVENPFLSLIWRNVSNMSRWMRRECLGDIAGNSGVLVNGQWWMLKIPSFHLFDATSPTWVDECGENAWETWLGLQGCWWIVNSECWKSLPFTYLTQRLHCKPFPFEQSFHGTLRCNDQSFILTE